MYRIFYKIVRVIIIFTASIALLISCTTTHRTTQSKRTAVEQLLISESVVRSLSQKSNELLPISSGSKVILNSSGLTADQSFLQEVLSGWLGRQGYLIQKDKKNSTYRIDVIVSSMGTEEYGAFIGLPPIQSQIIPFSLPELAFYKSEKQTGYVKFNMNFFETLTGKFIGSSPIFIADSYHNRYILLFLLSYTSTNLKSPPKLGFFRNKLQNTEDEKSERNTIFDWW